MPAPSSHHRPRCYQVNLHRTRFMELYGKTVVHMHNPFLPGDWVTCFKGVQGYLEDEIARTTHDSHSSVRGCKDETATDSSADPRGVMHPGNICLVIQIVRKLPSSDGVQPRCTLRYHAVGENNTWYTCMAIPQIVPRLTSRNACIGYAAGMLQVPLVLPQEPVRNKMK